MKALLPAQILFLFLGWFALSSCEDPIALDLGKGTSQLAVDAMVKVNDGPQSIRLTLTSTYFDNSKAQPATGAVVSIESDQGQTIVFTEDPINPGIYRNTDSIRGQTGELFGLKIQYKGEQFGSVSVLMRGTKIDTLNQEERPSQFGNPAGTYVNLMARDSVGFGDFYWIRYSLNGITDSRPAKITVSADAAFNPGDADGLDFIFPIRNVVNNEKPYEVDDTLAVEILSIDYENFRFLNEMLTQINNTGLFAEPIANVRGNIYNLNPSSKTSAVGCFGMARISKAGVRIK